MALMLWQAKPSLADSITGTVHNQTTGKPSGGDEVVLLRLGEGMQEQGRTKTDAQGSFTLPVSVASAEYVVRVLHQGVNYDHVATSSSTLQIPVYDAVTRIAGLSGSIGMAQIESNGSVLKVTEMYAIRNATDPPVTQFNPRNFAIFIPAGASLDSAEVRSGAGMWTKAPLAESPGARREYDVNFPLRPGDTLFKFVYHLPYAGPTTLRLKLAYPIQKFAIMHPPSMSFRALHPNTFVNPGLAGGFKVEKSVAEPLSGDVPPFVISGIGTAAAAAPAEKAVPPTTAPPSVMAPPQSVAPSNPRQQPATRTEGSRQPSGNLLWLLVATAIALLAAISLMMWRKKRGKGSVAKPASSGESLLEALREELFQLESERLHGSISAEEYASTKAALNLGIQRALAKKQ